MSDMLKNAIRSIENFPKEGILFRDITTVLQNKDTLKHSVDVIVEDLEGIDFDLVIGPESRGFIFGMPVAYKLNKGFIPVRKPGKLPFDKESISYDLEYGSSTLEIHKDAIKKGQKVVIVDDLLATAGTAKAMIQLIEKLGGEIAAIVFFIELEDLNGRELLEGYNVKSILKY